MEPFNADGTEREVAERYAALIQMHLGSIDWVLVNATIVAKHSRPALGRIKTLAWKIIYSPTLKES